MTERHPLLERAVENYAPDPQEALGLTMRKAKHRQRRRRASVLAVALASSAEFKNTLGPDGLIETKWVHGGP